MEATTSAVFLFFSELAAELKLHVALLTPNPFTFRALSHTNREMRDLCRLVETEKKADFVKEESNFRGRTWIWNRRHILPNGWLHGDSIRYREDGGIKWCFSYRDGIIHGPSSEYHDSGSLERSGAYYEGNEHGLHEWWYDTTPPRRQQRTFYSYGYRDGLEEKWCLDGTLEETCTWTAGRRDGLHRLYHEGGTLGAEIPFDYGVIHGTQRTWTDASVICSETEYKRGDQDGPDRRYHANGVLMEELQYKKGRSVGDFTAWHDNGQKRTWIHYCEEYRHPIGLQPQWDPEGVPLPAIDHGSIPCAKCIARKESIVHLPWDAFYSVV